VAVNALRRILLWAAFCGIVALAALSMAGAFLGAERARELFNSVPLSVYWIVFTALLAGGFAAFPALVRRGGMLAVHLGCLLILLGGMWGSPAAHRARKAFLGRDKIVKGFVPIVEGASANRVIDRDQNVLGTLPFDLRLERLHVEYEPPEADTWALEAVVVVPEPEGEGALRLSMPIEWKLAREADIPFTDARLRVMKYHQPTPGSVPSLLHVRTKAGHVESVPAEVGRQIKLADPKVTLRVVRTFRGFRIDPETGEAFDAPGGAALPAVEVQVTREDGKKETRYAFPPGAKPHGRADDDLTMVYYHIDPEELPPPQMEIELLTGREGRREWLVPRPGSTSARLSLPPSERWRQKGGVAALVFYKPRPAVRQFKANVTVLDAGTAAAGKLIAVNQPLHYGGYHFYVEGCGDQLRRHVILKLVSDSGLNAVYGGFVLLCVGVLWHFWLRPIAAARRRGRR
jgi:hypothetical protein